MFARFSTIGTTGCDNWHAESRKMNPLPSYQGTPDPKDPKSPVELRFFLVTYTYTQFLPHLQDRIGTVAGSGSSENGVELAVEAPEHCWCSKCNKKCCQAGFVTLVFMKTANNLSLVNISELPLSTFFSTPLCGILERTACAFNYHSAFLTFDRFLFISSTIVSM